MFEEVITKLENTNNKKAAQGMSNPILRAYQPAKNDFLDKLTQHAVAMFEKKCDIKNFSKLAISDMNEYSTEEIARELNCKGISDPFEDEKLAELADNEKFLKDLGLI